MKFSVVASLAGAVLLLGACTDAKLIERVSNLPSTEKGFKTNLHLQYVVLAEAELEESDYFDAGIFARRGEAAALGKDVDPDNIYERSFTPKNLAMVGAERVRLVRVLDAGARKKHAAIAARAQTQFDCWVQELEENNQPKDIAACRAGYEAAIKVLEAKLAAKPKMKKMAAKPMKKMVEKPKPKPKKKKMVSKGPFTIYFEFDSADIRGGKAGSSLVKAMRAIKAHEPSSVVVVGHTDSAGRNAYNRKLAAKRANAVRDALSALGIDGTLIDPVSVGESGQEKRTKDGVREGANRRATIKLY
jgi:OOP family OmpA-OmpF porin